MDYGRYRYEQTKKKHEAKKKQAAFKLKEIKVRPKTGEHDLMVKLNRIKEFISKKDKVKVTVMFRGREIALTNMGRSLLERIAAETQDIALVEQFPKFDNRTLLWYWPRNEACRHLTARPALRLQKTQVHMRCCEGGVGRW
jgi:translation initiation factor IF-3